MIERVRFADHVVLAAIGIDVIGKKYTLGLREGAIENMAACQALLVDLIERGLPTERSLFFVIDGAKALRKAITDTFGLRALIQRCREHKKRNVTDALPERMRSTMGQAYASRDPKRARQLPENLEQVLSSTNLIENLFSRLHEIARRMRR
jgi:putative transposase